MAQDSGPLSRGLRPRQTFMCRQAPCGIMGGRSKLQVRDYEQGRSLLARLDYGTELIRQITILAEEKRVETGAFWAIGALSQAELAYYDQASLEYRKITVEGPVELVHASGNLSLRDGRPFVHAHGALADSKGGVLGGHLIREHDPVTGLHLWSEA
jgi:predicted DNA-binding protein with PD1-like motif